MTCGAAAASAQQEEVAGDLLPVLQALADPTRLRIVLMLRQREQCVCDLTEALGLTQGTISHHMGVLKRAGLVRDRRNRPDGRWVYYALVPEARDFGCRIAGLLDASQMDPAPAHCDEPEAALPRKQRCNHSDF